MNENKLVEWANALVPAENRIAHFKDKQLKSSIFFLKVMQSIEPRAINQDLITPGVTDEEVTNNAKYAISVARKLGAAVFLVWEHIRDVIKQIKYDFIQRFSHNSYFFS